MSDLPDAPDVSAAPEEPAVPTFEQGFAAVEAAADAAEASAKRLMAAASKLRQTAQEGTLVKLRPDIENLKDALIKATDRVGSAEKSWPFTQSEEVSCMRDRYAEELRTTLDVPRRDNNNEMVYWPSIIQVLTRSRAVKINGKKRTGIRPTKLEKDLRGHATALKKQLSNTAPTQLRRFLDALYKAYKLTDYNSSVKPLIDVYDVLTLLPVVGDVARGGGRGGKQYTEADFVRDIYLLDRSTVNATSSGESVTFTDGDRQTNVLKFPDQDGNRIVQYYGVKFSEGTE